MIALSSKLTQVIRTINLYSSFLGLGLCISITGPTLIDLEKNVGTDTEHMSYVLAARSGAYLFGSIFGGLLLDQCNRQILLASSVFMMGATTVSIPYLKSFWMLLVNVSLGGVFMGSLDTGGGVLCLDIWKENPSPFLQAMHFMYGTGAFIAPLIAEPFLSPEAKSESQSLADSAKVENEVLKVKTNFGESYSIIYPYAIVGGITLFVSFCCIGFYLIHPQEISSNTEKYRPMGEIGIGRTSVAVITLAACQMMFYVGVELAYTQFLAAFAVKSDLKLTKSVGSFLTSVFWCAYMASRFLSIYTATKYSPLNLLFFNIVMMTFGTVILSIWGSHSESLLWGGNFILGFGMGSTFPNIYSWAERYVGISNKISGLLLTSGSFGGMIFQLLVGAYIEQIPMVVIYFSLGGTLVCLFILALQWRLKIMVLSKVNPDHQL